LKLINGDELKNLNLIVSMEKYGSSDLRLSIPGEEKLMMKRPGGKDLPFQLKIGEKKKMWRESKTDEGIILFSYRVRLRSWLLFVHKLAVLRWGYIIHEKSPVYALFF